MNSEDRIQQLEARVAELATALENVRSAAVIEVPAHTADEVGESARAAHEAALPAERDGTVTALTSSRRNMLKLAGAAAAGAAAAVAANALPAAALDGDPLEASTEVST